MANTTAPAIGGASGSNPPIQLHSAWNPYSVLPPNLKRKINPKHNDKTTSFLTSLDIPTAVAVERLSGKYLQLEPPQGKESDERKAELIARSNEKAKKKKKVLREGECGLIGRRKRKVLEAGQETTVQYEAVFPMHQLWIGYMAELLALPLIPPVLDKTIDRSFMQVDPPIFSMASALLPVFPARPAESTSSDLRINVATLHAKLVKAEFIGCLLCGLVKRAKNPSLVKLEGIILQETQGTFKIVTPASQIKVLPKKGSIFTFSLPIALPTTMTLGLPPPLKRDLSFDIFGDAFIYRSAERVNKKWKAGGGTGGVAL